MRFRATQSTKVFSRGLTRLTRLSHGISRLFLPLFLLLGLFTPGPVHASQPQPATSAYADKAAQDVVISNVVVDIWPEYDQPTVLVIYHVTLSAQVSLPTAVTLRIPSSVARPFAVAWQSTDKALYDLKYDTKITGEWNEISFTTPASDVQIEYYDPTIKKTGTQRDFTYRWSGKYPVQNLSLQAQQPVKATNVTFRPDVGSGRTGDDGLTYYTLQVGAVKAGTTVNLNMTYTKPDDTLTNTEKFQDARPNQSIDSGTSGRVTFDQFLPWMIGGLGLVLIALGLVWYWRTGRIPARQAVSRPRHGRSAQPSGRAAAGGASVNHTGSTSAAAASGESVFCYQCGKKAAPGDAFCRSCGTKLR